MIEVKNLKKRYRGNDYDSIHDLNFSVKEGECIAFLGPNGSGKSTLMRILCGILPQSGGELWVDGCKFPDEELRKQIGYLPESNNLPEFLRISGFFNLIGQLYMLPKAERKARWREYCKFLDLPRKRKKISKLSQGNKRKILISQALINRPKILLLDEPTVYLDLLIKHNFYNYLQDLKLQGVTIIITSHVLSEIEKLADKIFIFREGCIQEELCVKDITHEADWEYEVIKKII